MSKRLIYGALAVLLTLSISACQKDDTKTKTQDSTPVSSSIDEGPKKGLEFTSVVLRSESDKAYVVVSGKETNYTADEFKWAWGLLDDSGEFIDGKENPAADDFKSASFSANGTFTLKYCLTDIANMKAGVLYRVYGGTPAQYGDIEFPSNQTGASDATRKYYLRSDQSNSLVFDNIQPVSFTKASVVEITETDLPTGVTNAGAYLKFGGANSKKLTVETIDGWNEAGNIAGNFQRVIGDGYQVHSHTDEERFYKIEGNEVFFYCYIGFIEEGEGWMVHFDLVSGNANANLQFDSTLSGETKYTAASASYRVYADKNKGGEENYWGCLGVYREAAE